MHSSVDLRYSLLRSVSSCFTSLFTVSCIIGCTSSMHIDCIMLIVGVLVLVVVMTLTELLNSTINDNSLSTSYQHTYQMIQCSSAFTFNFQRALILTFKQIRHSLIYEIMMFIRRVSLVYYGFRFIRSVRHNISTFSVHNIQPQSRHNHPHAADRQFLDETTNAILNILVFYRYIRILFVFHRII